MMRALAPLLKPSSGVHGLTITVFSTSSSPSNAGSLSTEKANAPVANPLFCRAVTSAQAIIRGKTGSNCKTERKTDRIGQVAAANQTINDVGQGRKFSSAA
jgi:hypothetical protein